MEKYKVPDMSCAHCEKSIKEALKASYPDSQVSVDLQNKIVSVENIPAEKVTSILDEIGYTVEKS